MDLSGTWDFQETWDKVFRDAFTATFKRHGTVTIHPPNPGFEMVWYTHKLPEQQGVVLAGANCEKGILVAYHGTLEADNMSMSGTATGKMVLAGITTPVVGTWKASRSEAPADSD